MHSLLKRVKPGAPLQLAEAVLPTNVDVAWLVLDVDHPQLRQGHRGALGFEPLYRRLHPAPPGPVVVARAGEVGHYLARDVVEAALSGAQASEGRPRSVAVGERQLGPLGPDVQGDQLVAREAVLAESLVVVDEPGLTSR